MNLSLTASQVTAKPKACQAEEARGNTFKGQHRNYFICVECAAQRETAFTPLSCEELSLPLNMAMNDCLTPWYTVIRVFMKASASS